MDWNDTSGATHYKVYWRLAGPGNPLNAGVEAQSSNLDITVAAYGDWVVRVDACNGAGCGPRTAQQIRGRACAYGHSHAYRYCDSHRNSHSHGYCYTYRHTDGNSGACRRPLSGRVGRGCWWS